MAMGLLIMLACGVLLAAGIGAVVRWGGLRFAAPPLPSGGERRSADVVRGYLWYLAVAGATGIASGLLVAGPGGRLIMRLLAVTAGPEAQALLIIGALIAAPSFVSGIAEILS